MKLFVRLLRFVAPYWKLVALTSVVSLVGVGASLLAPWPMKFLIDNVLGDIPLPNLFAKPLGGFAESRSGLLAVAVFAGVSVAFLSNALAVVGKYINTVIEQRMILDFRVDLFQHAQRLSVAYRDQVATGRLMYAINLEAAQAGSVVSSTEPLIQSALTIIGMLWVSFRIDPLMALLALGVMPFLYYSVGYYIRKIQQPLYDTKMMEGDSMSIVHDAMAMVPITTAFGREDHEVQRYARKGAETANARIRITVRQSLFSLSVNMITAIGTALVVGFGARHVLQHTLTVGELLVIIAYIASVYKPLESISYTLGAVQDSLVGVRMAFEVRDVVPMINDAPNARKISRPRGQVTFDDVDFSYPTRPGVLNNISFVAQPGQVVAVVGPTGAGKTTLLSLLLRFYDPLRGRVLLDGRDIRDVTLRSLREQIAFVPQEPLLFWGTIAENIRYGRLGATDAEIVEAAKAANAHDFISALPKGYDTPVGERGVQLSGGERQRICVARAFLRDSKILILDEPTASIDSRTEAVILDALDRLSLGRTTFMIAHRLSTVRHADLILVLDRGRIVEHGTHDTLLADGGLYHRLHELQSGQRRGRDSGVPLPLVSEVAH